MRPLRHRWSTLTVSPAFAPPGRADLPEINAFVEIAINGSRTRRSVPVNAIAAGTLSTRMLSGLRAGDQADFVYTNDAGRFRFATVCTAAGETEAVFALPAEVKTLEGFANRRAAQRLEWLAPAHWRPAAHGCGFGEFLPASTIDISRAGMSLVVARRLEPGTQLEVRFVLESERAPLAAVSQVVRAIPLEKSNKSAAGVRFLEIGAHAARSLDEFVNERAQERRERGFV